MADLKDRLRSAVLFFRFHRDNPHVAMTSAALAEHMAALAEAQAQAAGHDTEDARFASGRTGDPHDEAPGRDDLPKDWKPGRQSNAAPAAVAPSRPEDSAETPAEQQG